LGAQEVFISAREVFPSARKTADTVYVFELKMGENASAGVKAGYLIRFRPLAPLRLLTVGSGLGECGAVLFAFAAKQPLDKESAWVLMFFMRNNLDGNMEFPQKT
jgi:hypothetical protein